MKIKLYLEECLARTITALKDIDLVEKLYLESMN